MVLLVLAVLWAIVLVPPVFRARAEARRRDHERGAEAVRRELAIVTPAAAAGAPVAPVPVVAPAAEAAGADPWVASPGPAGERPAVRVVSSAVQRRRRGLFAILGAAGTTFFAGLVSTAADQAALSWVWAVHVATDLLVVGYLVALAVAGWLRHRRPEEPANVRYLPSRQDPVGEAEEAAPALRQSASS